MVESGSRPLVGVSLAFRNLLCSYHPGNGFDGSEKASWGVGAVSASQLEEEPGNSRRLEAFLRPIYRSFLCSFF